MMKVSPSSITWGRYGKFSGPFFRGAHRYKLPEDPTTEDKIVAVITATEGSAYDAINMYDGQVLSTTLIQVTERRYFTASAAFGFAIEQDEELLDRLRPALKHSNVFFKKTPKGFWRFHFGDNKKPVTTIWEQSQLMLGCDGKRGSWGGIDSEQRKTAKLWALTVATFWGAPSARRAQVKYIAPRILKYAFYASAKLVEEGMVHGTAIGGAFVAAYLSFAVNNPTRANKHLGIALSKTSYEKWSMGWLIDVLKELTFGPCIGLYHYRYKAIRPVVESIYGVDLPDMAEDLKAWEGEHGKLFVSTEEVQETLIGLGYDLGPWGADGVYGSKTCSAVKKFEESEGLCPDGSLDIETAKRLKEVWERTNI